MDLLKYCGDDPVYRELMNPFSFGDYTYATDGHFAIRVPRDKRYNSDGNGRHRLVDKLLNATHDFKPIPMFVLPELEFVPEDEETPSCVLIINKPILFDEMGGNHGISICYLSWIVNFKNPLISFDCGKEIGNEKAVSFKFDGGMGAVMPMYT